MGKYSDKLKGLEILKGINWDFITFSFYSNFNDKQILK